MILEELRRTARFLHRPRIIRHLARISFHRRTHRWSLIKDPGVRAPPRIHGPKRPRERHEPRHRRGPTSLARPVIIHFTRSSPVAARRSVTADRPRTLTLAAASPTIRTRDRRSPPRLPAGPPEADQASSVFAVLVRSKADLPKTMHQDRGSLSAARPRGSRRSNPRRRGCIRASQLLGLSLISTARYDYNAADLSTPRPVSSIQKGGWLWHATWRSSSWPAPWRPHTASPPTLRPPGRPDSWSRCRD